MCRNPLKAGQVIPTRYHQDTSNIMLRSRNPLKAGQVIPTEIMVQAVLKLGFIAIP